MTLTFDDLSETCDQFWECECAENWLHRKGTMPTRYHEEPPEDEFGNVIEDKIEEWKKDWNITEYCPKCDADEQDCSDARTLDIVDIAIGFNLTRQELGQLLIEYDRLEEKIKNEQNKT